MSISIQTNVNSLVAQQNLSVTNRFQSQTITQLTSGYRINSSGDDAAGLAVANKFRSSVAELTQGVANGNDAVAQLQIMDGGMSNISQILDRLKTLATQSASSTFTGNRATLNTEFQTDIAEIDRQAQSIGLDTGGTFAKNLSVYLGQGSGSGSGSGGSAPLANANVGVDLSLSTVDAGSLGLKGMRAIAGSVGAAGTDIGTGSSNGTTVEDIVSANAHNAQAKTGYATFVLSGPGFAGNSKVSISANLAAVSDVNTLVAAINTAISNEAGGATQADQQLKAAGIVASVNTDQYGHQQLSFSSPSTAFQVQAGDQMANALMGNFATAGSPTGKAVTSTVTGDATAVSTAQFKPTNVSVQISGAGLAGPVTLKLAAGDSTVGLATNDLVNQVNQNKQLQDAGITASMNASNELQFTSATGSSFNVSSVGDTANALGLGTFVTTSALNGAASYSDITAGSSFTSAATGNGIATLAFSLNGGVTGGITAATVTGSAAAAGYTAGGTVANAAGALGTLTLTLNGSATPVTVDFAKDANQGATETVQQAADFINSQIQSQAGYGSDVKLATVDSATGTIKLTGPADGAGTVVAAGAAATALGLTDVDGATIVAASGSAGNTVSVNLAGNGATSALATGTAAAAANVATVGKTMQMNIDGVSVNADFANDVNSPGTVAGLTSGKLAADASSTVDITSIRGTSGTLTAGLHGANGATSVIDLSSFAAKKFSYIGTAFAAGKDDSDSLALTAFAAQKATFTGTSLGTNVGNNEDLTSLDLKQFETKNASATGGSFGIDMNAGVDLSRFAAKAATATSTVALPSSGLDFQSWAATKATMSGTAVALDDVTPIAGLNALDPTNIADDRLIINGLTVTGAETSTSLTDLASKINAIGGIGVVATALNGVLTLTSSTAGAGASIDVVSNNASAAAGLTTPGDFPSRTATGTAAKTLDITIDATTKSIDVSQAHNLTDVVAAINDNVTGFGAGKAIANADGTITLKGATKSTSGKVNVANTEVSNALGFTTGSAASNNAGSDAQKLRVNVDGLGELDIDVSAATTVGQVAAKINADLTNATTGNSRYGTDYSNVASGLTGALSLTSFVGGDQGEVHIWDDAVSQALKLTSGANVDNFGKTGQKLELTVDSTTYHIDVSSANDATALMSAINTLAGAGTATLGSGLSDNGALILTSTATGSSGILKVTDNAVSRILGLTTAGQNVDQKGKAATTLDIQIDGGTLQHIDLSAVGGGTPTVTAAIAAIKGQLNTAGVAQGYSTNFNYAAVSGNDDGTIKLASNVEGGGIIVKDNALSEYLGLTSSVTKEDKVMSRADQTLNLEIDGKKQVNIALDGLGTNARLADIADAINTALKNNSEYGAAYDHVAQATSDGTITLTGVVGGGTVKVVNSDLSTTALALTTAGADAINTGDAAATLDISIDGGATKSISFAAVAGGNTPTLTDIAGVINAAFSGDASYGAAYGSVATANADGTITLAGQNHGLAAGSMTIANNAAGQVLSLTSGTASTVSLTGQDETLAQVVSFLNNTAQRTLGTSIDAKIVSLDANGAIQVASQTKGANSSVSVASAGTTAGLAASLNLGGYVDAAAKGQGASLQSVVDTLKQAFNSNATLLQAGMTASIDQGTGALEISSSNGTQFRLDAWGTKNGTNDSDLGFGDTGKAFTNALSPTQSNANVLDVQGASAIGTFANAPTKNTASLSFQGMQFGNDDQTISISANSAAGVPQAPLTITLQNDSQAQTGATVASAVNAINTRLQQSDNATLRSITAVQETAADGTESINLISSLSSFSVSVSNSAGINVGDGLNGGKAQTFTSSVNGNASSISIDTQAGALQAVAALGVAVAKLGTAQGAIGRGQNQLGYAIGLAQSQITNFSSAESQIRDTNVAQQAANLSKAQVLSQAAIAAMAQANSAPQAVLALLRG